jgi:hypothetical protein
MPSCRTTLFVLEFPQECHQEKHYDHSHCKLHRETSPTPRPGLPFSSAHPPLPNMSSSTRRSAYKATPSSAMEDETAIFPMFRFKCMVPLGNPTQSPDLTSTTAPSRRTFKYNIVFSHTIPQP